MKRHDPNSAMVSRVGPTEPRYWYFVTSKDMGDKIRLKPRVPRSASKESRYLRICVSPTAAHCIAALDITGNPIRKFVYRTVRKAKAIYASEWVSDASITEEHWLRRTTSFIKVEELPAKVLRSVKHHNRFDSSRQEEYLCDMIEVLSNSFPHLFSCGWDD